MADDQLPEGDVHAIDIEAGSEEIARAWLETISRDGPGRPEGLLQAYRRLTRTVIELGLRATVGDDVLESGRDPVLDRALAGVAAAIRRSSLSIAEVVEDMGRLAPTIQEWLSRQPGASEQTVEVMQTTMRMLAALQGVQLRIVRVLEASAIRSQRERSETLAAMTDQLSHELRNRLGAARTAADMLLDSSIELDAEGLHHVAQLVQLSVEAALRTVGDVRALVASRANVEEPEPRPTALPRLIRSVLDELTPMALDADVRLELPGEYAECEVDASRLRLIVFNLVGNGIKYRDPEKDDPWVRVRSRRLDGRVELEISDNGIGMPENELEDVFLHRVRGAGSDGVPGSGLGLAIVQEAIDQIGGEIRVDSELGEGTTFTLAFEPLGWP